MLRATFLHLDGISATTEANLWRQGVYDWSDLLDRLPTLRLSADRADRLRRAVDESERALGERDAAYFGRRLPAGEHWRLYPTFRDRTAFLDIETTSLSPYEGIVTVVTVHGGGRTRSFVAEENLDELPAYLEGFRLWVTFNGRLFDVPFLKFRFPTLADPPAHLDLRFALYRLGQAGGLKRIEERLGLGSREGVEGLRGLDAVRLWQAHRRGSATALDLLVRYNRADTVNLEPLTEWTVRRLTARLLGERRTDEPAPPGTDLSPPLARPPLRSGSSVALRWPPPTGERRRSPTG